MLHSSGIQISLVLVPGSCFPREESEQVFMIHISLEKKTFRLSMRRLYAFRVQSRRKRYTTAEYYSSRYFDILIFRISKISSSILVPAVKIMVISVTVYLFQNWRFCGPNASRNWWQHDSDSTLSHNDIYQTRAAGQVLLTCVGYGWLLLDSAVVLSEYSFLCLWRYYVLLILAAVQISSSCLAVLSRLPPRIYRGSARSLGLQW